MPLTVRLDNLHRSLHRMPNPASIALFPDSHEGLDPQRSADLWPVLPVGAGTRWPESSACRIAVSLHGMRARKRSTRDSVLTGGDKPLLRADFSTAPAGRGKKQTGNPSMSVDEDKPSSDYRIRTEEFPMPQIAHNPTKAQSESSPQSAPPAPPPGAIENASMKPAAKEALFRALVEAGADAVAAYTAAEGAESMASESAAAQIQPVLLEIRQFARRMDERFTVVEQKLDALTARVADHDAKLDVLAARLDALQTEMRLMWGALGILTTVLIAVFGFLFTR